jgi:hypothetical protein
VKKKISNQYVSSATLSNPLQKKENEQLLDEQAKELSPAAKIQMISDLVESQMINIEEILDIFHPERKIERELKKSKLGRELL